MINKIFNKDFYPTPKNVIDLMMENESVEGMKVLEPSAGKGDIVDWMWQHGAADVIACETDKNLQKMLSGKCRLVCEDFMQLRSEDVSHVDYIVMNPPFAEAEKHILHAWDIAPSGCIIIALKEHEYTSRWSWMLKREEAEEVKRIYKLKAEMEELVNCNGNIKSLGRCFKDAERSTDIEVDMVKLYKQGTKENEWEGYFDMDEDYDEATSGTEGIMPYNEVRNIVNRYRDAVDMFDEVMEAANRINGLTDIFSTFRIKFRASDDYGNLSKGIFKKELQKSAWSYLFHKLDMEKYVTQKVRENINAFIENQQHIPFTMKNIYRMLDCIIQTHGQRMEQCIAEAFDLICQFSSDNCTAGETWRTNLNYMVNRRIIIPYVCEGYFSYSGEAKPYVDFGYTSSIYKVDDFLRAVNYIAGPGRETTLFGGTSMKNMKLSWGTWYDWGEFRIRCYKKGTMHMEFKDEKLWQEFNLRAAKQKGWKLSDNARRTHYNKQAV